MWTDTGQTIEHYTVFLDVNANKVVISRRLYISYMLCTLSFPVNSIIYEPAIKFIIYYFDVLELWSRDEEARSNFIYSFYICRIMV